MQNPRRRLTKQELKEDEFVTSTLQAWNYVEQNYPKILAGIGVVVAIFLIGVFIKQQSDRNARAAVEAMGQLEIALVQNDTDEAVRQAERIVTEYDGSATAGHTLLVLGNLYYELDRYQEAQSAYQRYLDNYEEAGPDYGAWAGLAACLEDQGDFMGAAGKYVTYADRNQKSAFAPLALKEAARCYELAGDVGQAREVLQRIVDQYADSPAARMAEGDLRQMQAMN